jgi:glycosyltransferase involved in cell wall biosynthesis
VLRLEWQPAGTAVADDPLSAAALPPHGVATLHYATALDLAGLRRSPRPHDVQDLRAERRLRRHRHLVLTYSDRVATWVGGVAVPVAVPIPDAPLPFVEAPVAAMVADWRWPPNQAALQRLLQVWPSVRADVPTAQLLLAGRGNCGVQNGDGVRVLGEVSSLDEVLGRAAVLAFPCPPTSGPKIKVIEAAARGIPVLTTVAGAEGLAPDSGVVTADEDSFGPMLAALLGDVARRQLLAGQVREAVAAIHAPVPAARARLAALVRHEEAQEQHEQPG